MLGMGAVLSGCTVQTPQTTSYEKPVSATTAPVISKKEVDVIQSKPTAERVVVSDTLTLSQAVALTLEKSPELQSFSQMARVGEAKILQAKLLPNPHLSLSIEDAFGPYGNDSYSQATLQLSQLIELGGKRTARIETATALRDQYNESYEVKRIEILTALTDKFIRTVADEQLLKLAEKGEKLAQQALQNIQRRSQAGGGSELEEAKARVLAARAHIAVEHAHHELISSNRELSAFWGEENLRIKNFSSDLFKTDPLPSFEALSARIEQSPEIKRWVTEKRLREAEKKLADVQAVPNIVIEGGPRRLEQMNDTSWVFQISVPLTLTDRNQGALAEAEILSKRVSFEETSARLRFRTTLFSLYQEAKHALTELETQRKEIIPQAEKALSTAQRGYNQGRFSYLELIDAQQTLLEVYEEKIEAAYRFHSLVNAIERLLGAPLNVATEN